MDFFDKLGESLAEAGRDVGQKAKDVSEIAKLKLDIRSKEDYVEKQFAALGRAYFEKNKDAEETKGEEQFFLIKEAQAEIVRMKDEVLRIQGAKECAQCGVKVPDNSTFCSNCGAKLNDIFEE